MRTSELTQEIGELLHSITQRVQLHSRRSRDDRTQRFETVALDTLFTEALQDVSDVVAEAAALWIRLRRLRHQMSPGNLWPLVENMTNPRLVAGRFPEIGSSKQWCSDVRFFEAYRAAEKRYECRFGKVTPKGKAGTSTQGRIIHGWPAVTRAASEYLRTGEVAPAPLGHNLRRVRRRLQAVQNGSERPSERENDSAVVRDPGGFQEAADGR